MEEVKEPDAVPRASQAVYLHADDRPEELRTLIYLHNGTERILRECTLRIHQTTLFEFATFQNEAEISWIEEDEISIISIYPGQLVLVNELSHEIWDLVNRYEFLFMECESRQKKVVAYDRALNAARIAQDQTAIKVTFEGRE